MRVSDLAAVQQGDGAPRPVLGWHCRFRNDTQGRSGGRWVLVGKVTEISYARAI